MVNAFGAYQTYYDGTLSRSPSDISWIGTFQGFFLLLVGSIAGPIYDKGYLRSLVISGSFFIVFGLMMTSISTEYYQVFLAQGVTVGLGCGLLLIPGLAVIAQYFTTKRALTIGIAASGGSVGALLYPIIFKRLQVQISFGWATRVIGFIALGTLIFSICFIKSRVPPRKTSRALIDMAAFRSPSFLIFTLGLFLYFMGIYFPFFYVSTWAQHYLGTDDETSFYLFSILNAGSMFGRIVPGLAADKLGSMNLHVPVILLTGMLSFAWIGVHNFGELVVFCIFYGFFSGAAVSLPGTIIVHIAPELNMVGTWMGMCFGLASIGLLIGNPIAGAILAASPDGSFVPAQCFSGAVVLAGGVCLGGLRYMKLRQGSGWKA